MASDKLTWFKFNPSDWMMGRIRKMEKAVQAEFMALICVYWNNECDLSIEDAELEVGKENLETLIKYKIVKKSSGKIGIKFLDDQKIEINNTSEKRRDAANKRWSSKENKDNAHDEQINASALQSDADKRREDKEKNRKDKDIEKRRGQFRELVRSHLSEKFTKEEGKSFFEYWTEMNSNGRKMRFEKEKVFDVSRRITTWLKNKEKWKKEKSSAKKEKDFHPDNLNYTE